MIELPHVLRLNCQEYDMKVRATFVVCLMIGLVILAIAFSVGRQQMSFEANSKLAQGIVKDVLTSDRLDLSKRKSITTKYFTPVVEFRTDSGVVMTHRSDSYPSQNPYGIGMEVEVRYNPANPAESQLDDGFRNWFGPIALSIVGLLVLVLGILTASGHAS